MEPDEFYDAVDHFSEEGKEGSVSDRNSPSCRPDTIEDQSDLSLQPLALEHRRSLSESELQQAIPPGPTNPGVKRSSLRAHTLGIPVKVPSPQTHKKDVKEFEGLILAQELIVSLGDDSTIWVAKFSPTGQFLAISGQQPAITLFEVAVEREEINVLPLFNPSPYRTYLGHTRPVVDLSWSRSGTHFISASMDKTAILWKTDHPSQLFRFSHPDIVSAVSFNPYVRDRQNANFFISGCFDKMIRVWNIPQDRVEACYQTTDLVTAVSCCADTPLVIVGLRLGQCIVYEASADVKLKFRSQVECKNRKGRKSKGRKVTGIEFLDETQFLVTTNDSRARLINLSDFSMKQKYKGSKNEQAPIKATFSHNFSHVISGSDNGNVYIWNLHSTHIPRLGIK